MALGYTMHGFSLNVNNDTSPFRLITPCGIQGIRVASLQTVAKKNVSVKAVYREITKCYSDVFQVQMTAIGIKAMMQRLGVINNMVKV